MVLLINILYILYFNSWNEIVCYFGICNIILSSLYDSFILYKFNVKII